jgi:hypothetical protein
MTQQDQDVGLNHVTRRLAQADKIGRRVELVDEGIVFWLSVNSADVCDVFGTTEGRYYFESGLTRQNGTWRARRVPYLMDLEDGSDPEPGVAKAVARRIAGPILHAATKWLDRHPNALRKAKYECLAATAEMQVSDDPDCNVLIGWDHAWLLEVVDIFTQSGEGRLAGAYLKLERQRMQFDRQLDRQRTEIMKQTAAVAKRARKMAAEIRV